MDPNATNFESTNNKKQRLLNAHKIQEKPKKSKTL